MHRRRIVSALAAVVVLAALAPSGGNLRGQAAQRPTGESAQQVPIFEYAPPFRSR
jgi:hypothetical protein